MVFAPKYRRKAFYDARRVEIGKILRHLCECKGINIIEAEVCIDHVHMLIEIPPKMSISGFMGYFVDIVGKNEKVIQEYIRNQLLEDKLYDQMSMAEFIDPFTGEQVKGDKKSPLRASL